MNTSFLRTCLDKNLFSNLTENAVKNTVVAESNDEKTSLHSVNIKCDGEVDGNAAINNEQDADESDDSTEVEPDDDDGSNKNEKKKQRKISTFCSISLWLFENLVHFLVNRYFN